MPFQLPPTETPPGVTPPKTMVVSRKDVKTAYSLVEKELADIEYRKKMEQERKRQEEEEQELKRLQEEEKKEKERKEKEEMDKKPKAKVVIAADSDAIFDWQLRKMIVSVPMHLPCRSYLERCVCEKMKWPDMVGYYFYKALGSAADNVESTNELLQTNLTPTQLRFTETGVNFVMVRKARRTEDEVLISANEYFRTKVEKFLELYDPHRLPQAGQLLKDNFGTEQNLIDALLTRYGPEPTIQQIEEKRAFLKKQRELAEEAAARAREAGLTNSIRTLSEREKENVLRILEKIAFTRVQTNFYRKWRQHVLRRRLNRMIVTLSVSNLEKLRRKEYFGKLKMFAENRKNKRQLTVSSQIAIRNESLLGDLASDNMGLKNEIRKLTSHIEVLQNASSKRLETLYSGSEAAVAELKRLTSELRNKGAYVHSLVVKEEQAKAKLANAEQIRDETIQQCHAKTAEFDAIESEYRLQLRLQDNQNLALQDKITELQRDVAGTGTCKHCPHYHEMVAQTTKHAALIDTLRTKIENTEASKRNLAHQIEQQKEELAAITSGPDSNKKSKAQVLKEQQEQENRVPQIFLDIEAAIRRQQEEELAEQLAREGLFSAANQEAIAKKKLELQAEEEKKAKQRKAELEEKARSGSPASSGATAASQSLLGPVGKADLSMARYFENEINRSRGKFQSALQKQWSTRAHTPYAKVLEERRKDEASEAAQRNHYHITRRQANAANAALLAESDSMFAAGIPGGAKVSALQVQHNQQQQSQKK